MISVKGEGRFIVCFTFQ